MSKDTALWIAGGLALAGAVVYGVSVANNLQQSAQQTSQNLSSDGAIAAGGILGLGALGVLLFFL